MGVAVEIDGTGRIDAALTGPGRTDLGPLTVELADGWRWSVANRGDTAVRVRSARVVFAVVDPRGPLRMFRNGYQSWSPCGVATLGVDSDPSSLDPVPALVRSTHHADDRPAPPGDLRSELVTVLADDGPGRVLVGFDGGAHHDGTIWLRRAGDRPVLEVEAFLGGAELGPGASRELHGFGVATGEDHSALLEAWAQARGASEAARAGGPYQVGWCSWYHYFGAVTEADLVANLAHAEAWPFDVFQLDDGYQPTIGDWLATNERFPSDLDAIATRIATAGRRPGISDRPLRRPT